MRWVWNPRPCFPFVIVGHTFGVVLCPLVHGLAEFVSAASATLFGLFDPRRLIEWKRAGVTEGFHDPARCGKLGAPSVR